MTQIQTYWLLYRGFLHYCGVYHVDKQRYALKLWHITHPAPPGGHVCWICHKHINKAELLSLDHVIPKDLVFTLGLESWLLWDTRNLQPAHKYCNGARMNELPSREELLTIPYVSSALLLQREVAAMLITVERARYQVPPGATAA